MSNTDITDADRKTPTYHAVFNLISQARDNPMRQSYGELADDCYAKIQADLQSRLDKAEAENKAMRKAARDIRPYLTWTISDESCGHHPTMPSAVSAFICAFPEGTFDKLTTKEGS